MAAGVEWSLDQNEHQQRVIRVSMMCSLKSWVIYFPIGCRHPSIRYWQPLPEKTTATWSLPNPKNQ
jgi:hypothetical protein